MSDITLDQVIQLVDQLSETDRLALVQHLQISTPIARTGQITLDMIKAEHARKVSSGAFANARSLAGRWAKPELNLSEEELRAGIKTFANEWEQELDDYKPD